MNNIVCACVHVCVCMRTCVCVWVHVCLVYYLFQDGLLLDIHLHNVQDIKGPGCGCLKWFNTMSTKILTRESTENTVYVLLCVWYVVCVCVCDVCGVCLCVYMSHYNNGIM